MCVHMSVSEWSCVYICVLVNGHCLHMCVSEVMCVHMCVSERSCVYICMLVNGHVCTYVLVNGHVCTYVC